MEQADRARRAAEQELNDANEAMSDLKVQNQSIAANKRRMEAELDNLKVHQRSKVLYFIFCSRGWVGTRDMSKSLLISLVGTGSSHQFRKSTAFTLHPTLVVVNDDAMPCTPSWLLQQDLDEMNSEAMMTEDKARRAMMDAAKLAEELRLEQEHTTRADGERRAMEAQVKDLQVRGEREGKRERERDRLNTSHSFSATLLHDSFVRTAFTFTGPAAIVHFGRQGTRFITKPQLCNPIGQTTYSLEGVPT